MPQKRLKKRAVPFWNTTKSLQFQQPELLRDPSGLPPRLSQLAFVCAHKSFKQQGRWQAEVKWCPQWPAICGRDGGEALVSGSDFTTSPKSSYNNARQKHCAISGRPELLMRGPLTQKTDWDVTVRRKPAKALKLDLIRGCKEAPLLLFLILLVIIAIVEGPKLWGSQFGCNLVCK